MFNYRDEDGNNTVCYEVRKSEGHQIKIWMQIVFYFAIQVKLFLFHASLSRIFFPCTLYDEVWRNLSSSDFVTLHWGVGSLHKLIWLSFHVSLKLSLYLDAFAPQTTTKTVIWNSKCHKYMTRVKILFQTPVFFMPHHNLLHLQGEFASPDFSSIYVPYSLKEDHVLCNHPLPWSMYLGHVYITGFDMSASQLSCLLGGQSVALLFSFLK